MAKFKKAVPLETAYGTYILDEQVGNGGSAIVYGGSGPNGESIAVKVLHPEASNTDKRKRFKNEIEFHSRCVHAHVVPVIDRGHSSQGPIVGPFYVMKRYDKSLRDVLKEGIKPDAVLPLFLQMLDGVEAAHKMGVLHRDLKPENFLWDAKAGRLAVADFGAADVPDGLAVTMVETKPQQRLANFQYAAPEQRVVGRKASAAADIYALGLMLNEMFTGEVPHGQDYKTIESVASQLAHLDKLVAMMLQQSASSRPQSIDLLKGELERLTAEVVARQKISQIDGTVVLAEGIDNPLALEAPRLVGADWSNGVLTLALDRPVNAEWVEVIQNRLGSYTSIVPPESFVYQGNQAKVQIDSHNAQGVIDYFKQWLPQATTVLRTKLELAERQRRAEREAELKRQREREEERLRVMGSLRI
jgi:serine/threonine protein kinase